MIIIYQPAVFEGKKLFKIITIVKKICLLVIGCGYCSPVYQVPGRGIADFYLF